MGNKNVHRNRILETSVRSFGDRSVNPEKRSAQFHGPFIHSGNNHNNNKMGEVVKVLANTLGGTVFIMGIIANLNNWIAIALGAAGFGFAVYRCLKERENWLIRKIERKERERSFKFGRTMAEEEQAQYGGRL